jgi:hypothetical protein
MQKSNSERKSCSVISYFKYLQFYLSIDIKIYVIFIKIMLNFVQSNTTYFSGGNMFRLTNKSSPGHPVT